MIDKILKAARVVGEAAQIHDLPGGTIESPNVERVITTDVEAFEELVRLVEDYFNPGRAPGSLCQFCQAPLVWIKTGNNSRAPLDAAHVSGLDDTGRHHRIRLSHFATCPRPPRRKPRP
ncbi:MAG: hypothetical protein GY898_23145 [Proteobacteria bacterium]|nr:hypothetical protein [Pseudomonadota bacterium]